MILKGLVRDPCIFRERNGGLLASQCSIPPVSYIISYFPCLCVCCCKTLTAEGIWSVLDYKFLPFGNAYYSDGMAELGCPGSKVYSRNEGVPCWQESCGDATSQPDACFQGLSAFASSSSSLVLTCRLSGPPC